MFTGVKDRAAVVAVAPKEHHSSLCSLVQRLPKRYPEYRFEVVSIGDAFELWYVETVERDLAKRWRSANRLAHLRAYANGYLDALGVPVTGRHS